MNLKELHLGPRPGAAVCPGARRHRFVVWETSPRPP
jgi:hypothetical protein